MKKVSLLIFVSLILLLAFTSCTAIFGNPTEDPTPNTDNIHTHEWTDATCTAPKTCACGETEGAALGHDWTDATCTAPKTCKTCEATEGEALGHDWADADCTTPKTCKTCNETEGEALGHDWADATCTAPKTCKTCNETEGEALGHNWADATCTAPKTCKVCGTTDGEALGHTEEVVPGTEATCTATGLTDGKKCSVCGETLLAQEVIPMKDHTEEVVPGTDATCTATGLTEGKKCSVCGETLVAQTTIDALGHTEEVVPGTDATCTTDGLTEGKKCSVCGETLVAQETIGAFGHTPMGEMEENRVEPTCKAPGGYDMVNRCFICDGIITSEHTVLPQLDHVWGEYTYNNDATCTADGTETATCTLLVCGGVTDTRVVEGSALGHAMPDAPVCGEHWTCTRECGYVSEEPLAHTMAPATCIKLSTCTNCGHTEGTYAPHTPGEAVQENYVAPGCETAGSYDEVVYCTLEGCGAEVSRTAKFVDATGHNMSAATCDAPSTCENGCGKTEGEKVANHTPVATLANGKLTYQCTTCNDSFTTDELLVYTGADKGDLFFTKNGDPTVKITDGAYEFMAGEQRSQIMIYGPSNSKNHANSLTKWGEGAFGVFAFDINPGTITEELRVIVMSARDNSNWDANGSWNGNSVDVLSVKPNGDGTFNIYGKSITSNVFATVTGDEFVNVQMFIQMANNALKVSYYINGNFCNTYTLDFAKNSAGQSIKNLDINCFYMCGWTAPGTGFALDNIYFGAQQSSEWLFEEHRHVWADATCEAPKTCTACGLTEGAALGHTEATRNENVVAPDCENTGHHDVVTYCTRCQKELGRETVEDAALGHQEQVVPGYPATCTENGLTDGKVCTREGCKNPNLQAQQPILATGHTDADNNKVCDDCETNLDCDHVGTGRVTVEGTDPTCTANGLSAGEKCAICGEFTTPQTEVPALGHTEATRRENAVAPTCTADGKYDLVTYCTVCQAEISRANETVDPATGHTEVKHDAQAPTCTEAGWNAYVTCANCDYNTKQSVPATGHSYSVPSCIAAETCTVCGATKGAPNTNAHSLQVTYSGNALFYACQRCDYRFDVETFDYSDGTNYNGMHANASQNNTVYTTNGSNYPVQKDGYLEFIRTDAESGAQKQLQMWLPTANGGTNKFSGFTAASNSIGYLSFRVDAKTDVNFEMKLVDHRVDKIGDENIRWGDKWAINDPVFRVLPAENGVAKLVGFNATLLANATVDENGFTGWYDVAIQIVLDPVTDKVIAHYYINGEYVTTSSRELSTHTDAIQAVYINFNSKAAGCGYRIDNLTFGYSAHKHNLVPTVVNGAVEYVCNCGTNFTVASEYVEWNGDGSDSAMKNVPNGNVELSVNAQGQYEYIFKPHTDTAPDFSASGTQSGDGWYEYDTKGYAGGQLQMWMPSNNRGESTFTGFSCENDSVGVISFNVKTNLSRHPDWDTSLTFSVGKPRNAADWNDSNGDGVNDSWSDDSINIFTIEEYQASGIVVKGGLNGTNLNLTTIPVTEDGWSEWFNVMIVIEMTKEEYINVYYYINGALLGTDTRDLNNPAGYRTLNPKKIEALQISGWTYVPNTGIVFDDFYFGYTANGHNTLDGHVHNLTETTCGEKSTCVCGWSGYTVAHTFATDCSPACSVCGLASTNAAAHDSLVPTVSGDKAVYVCADCGYCYTVKGDNLHTLALNEVNNATTAGIYDFTYKPGENYLSYINNGTDTNAQHQFWVPGQTESPEFADCKNANGSTVFLSFSINAKDHHNTGIEFKINANRGTSDWGGPSNNGWSESSVGIFRLKPWAADATTVALTGYNGADLGTIAINGENGWTGWYDVVVVMHLNTDNTITVEYYINGSLFKTLHADFVIWTHEINSLYVNGRTNGEGQGYELKNFFFGYTNDGMSQYQAPLYKEVIAAENVTDEALKTIVASKIKQCDQTSAPTVEGGTPVYVLAEGKDGNDVEALYISRTYAWTTETVHFTEFRFAVNGENKSGPATVSFSFDYLVRGTVETNDRYTFTDLEGNTFSSDAYVQVKTATDHALAGDNYPELSGTDLILDGEWHTMTYTFDEPLIIIDILLNLYHFQGELLIANLNVKAESNLYNDDGSLNVTEIGTRNASEDNTANVTDAALLTIVDGKIKQFDQTNKAAAGDTTYGYFVKEVGTSRYVTLEGKDGNQVEAVYLSRSVDWDTYASVSTQNGFKSEFRFGIDNTKRVTSISFDYILNGSLTGNRSTGNANGQLSIFQIKYTNKADNTYNPNDQYFDVITDRVDGENNFIVTDGEWHTFSYTFENSVKLDNFLIILSEFQGEIVIANLEVTYE